MNVNQDELRGGERLGDFRIVRHIGHGGMGSVYIAEDERLGRRVALKVIRPEFALEEGFRRRFEAEARGAAAIDHPNVVPILSAGADRGHLYLAMRYVDGQNLNEVLARHGALEVENCLRITTAIASALDAAHAAGLVHRDVTPGNILLAGELGVEGIYLTDFGLVRQIDSGDTRLTRTNEVIANLDYAAPEQITSGRVNARTDIYGLGCVLYRMRSGERPFPGTDTQKMWKIVNDPLPSLGNGDDPLDTVIARATAKDPDDRYRSAGDMARAATALAAGWPAPTEELSVATGVAESGYSESSGRSESATAPLEREVFVSHDDGQTEVVSQRSTRPGRRAIHVLALAGLAILAGAIIAVGIASSGGGNGKPKTITKSTTVTTAGEETSGTAGETTTPSSEAAVSRAEPKLREYTGRIYTASVPLEWQQDFELEEKPPYYPALFSAPNEPGEPYVRLEGQYPAKVSDPVSAEEGSRQITSESPDYHEISFGPTVIGGREAVAWNYEVEGDRRVVYGFIECGGGLGMVGSASPEHFAEFAPVFEEIAASFHVLCQN